MRWLLYRNPKCACAHGNAKVLQALPVRVGELLCAQESCKIFFLFEHSGEVFFFFSPRPPLNEGETEGYVKLTAEEIAVRRSQHFFFLPECFSSPV